MNADRFAFDQLRFKSLDRQTVQSRRAVQKNRMTFGDLLEDVPNFRGLALDHFLRAAHGVHVAEIFESADDEGLEQNERHLFRQAALIQFQLWTDDNDRTARIIDSLA